MKALLLFCLLMGCSGAAWTQAIGLDGPAQAGRNGCSLQYQNDAFGKTDYYYSQGIQVAVALPARRRTLLTRLFPGYEPGAGALGIALEHDAYTPTSILSDSILQGDRPYAAALMLQGYHVSAPKRQATFSTLLSVGIVGPAAGGYELQTAIHRNTHNDLPHGWQYQVRNNLILNYTLRYEYRLFRFRDMAAAAVYAGAAAGTYSDKAFAGAKVCAGLLERAAAPMRRLRLYLAAEGSASLIGYDATLQGGLFRKQNPYTITAAEVQRIVFRHNLALHAGFGRLDVCGSFTWLSPEFRTGRSHAWGGMQLACRF